MEKRVAVIGIVVEKEESAETVNAILHEYRDVIVGEWESTRGPRLPRTGRRKRRQRFCHSQASAGRCPAIRHRKANR